MSKKDVMNILQPQPRHDYLTGSSIAAVDDIEPIVNNKRVGRIGRYSAWVRARTRTKKYEPISWICHIVDCRGRRSGHLRASECRSSRGWRQSTLVGENLVVWKPLCLVSPACLKNTLSPIDVNGLGWMV